MRGIIRWEFCIFDIMRYYLLLFILFGLFLKAESQFTYEIKTGPLVKIDGFDLVNAFIGGLNSPQFTEFDLDQDGTNDLIVFDRSDSKIVTFLRGQKNNFIYAPQYENQLPRGLNIYAARDINSDGKLDIFTTSETGDLLIYRNKTIPGAMKLSFDSVGPWYYRNHYADNFPILYNPLSFSNAYTDLLGIEDLDGDGDIDIVNYDQFNLTYMMFKDVRSEKKWDKDTFEFQNMDYCFGFFWEGFDSEIKLNNCPFDLGFPKKLNPRHVGGASCWFFDEDNDGDKEMYLANLDSKRITRLKNGKSESGHHYDTMIVVDSTFLGGKSFDGFVFPGGYMIDVDGDGLKDMIIAPNSVSETKEKNQIHYYKNKGSKNAASFSFERDNFLIEQMLDFGGHSSPAFLDFDNDGDLDLLVLNNGDFDLTSGNRDRISLFENIGTKDIPTFKLKDSDFLNLSDSSISGASLAIGDVDNDGKMDLLIGTLSGDLFYFRNQGNQWVYKTRQLVNYQKQKGETSWAPAIIDYNKDGINDLLIGLYNGNVMLFNGKSGNSEPEFEWITSSAWGIKSNLWLENTSEPKFSSYGYAAPAAGDIDGDGTLEIVVGGYDNILRVYHIDGHNPSDSLLADENVLFYVSNESDTLSHFAGGRLRPALGNIAGDSIPELILGNLRGGLNFASHIKSSDVSINNQILKSEMVKPYPNPVKNGNRLHVLSPQTQYKWNVRLYDINGKLWNSTFLNSQEKGIGFMIEELNPGMYILALDNDQKSPTIHHKILITD
jgi:hypothetical protein